MIQFLQLQLQKFGTLCQTLKEKRSQWDIENMASIESFIKMSARLHFDGSNMSEKKVATGPCLPPWSFSSSFNSSSQTSGH